ncbi:MAG: DNA mismatch repair protein MutS [Chloroflexota bacterium]|nr:DNA mismatch repair protein MutS [Chloroflexota bacterium]MDE2948125.1 DNA mismatch repair protein MutS [Chloroflexota bacterium]
MSRVTPMRRQYLEIKSQYPDCILMFRMGDFYEMFDDDAEIAARELDITLTSRAHRKGGEKIPMAGVPYHSVDGYIAKLIDKGFHVAVCDQMSEPTGRGIVEREVTRVMTPGTVAEPALLEEGKANYLMGILPIGDAESGNWDRAGIAFADISTGEFSATQFGGDNVGVRVFEELSRLEPREVIMPETWVARGVTLPEGIHLSSVQDWTFEYAGAEQLLRDHFKVGTLDGFGLQNMDDAISAAGGVLQYLRTTQKGALDQLATIQSYSTDSFMVLDQFTRRNLELVETIRHGKTKGSLLDILDRTLTPMGARLLRSWLNRPLLELNRLNARLAAVEALVKGDLLRDEIGAELKGMGDIERLSNRITVGKAGPRDLIALMNALAVVPRLRELIDELSSLAAIGDRLDPCETTLQLIAAAISDDPPATLSHTGTMRAGYSAELDAILRSSQDARDWIANLEAHERRRTGIASIKVSFNKVFGYYIEVTNAHADKIPDDYVRKQTLVNAERYITSELKEYESRVLNAEEEILALERELFADVCRQVGSQQERLLRTARAIAHLDAFGSLAAVAAREGYTRPQLTEDSVLEIQAGRHPAVEKLLESTTRYVANDSHLDPASRIHIITGPNMSGKSTYIRQVAVITLMAQIGSFVPADSATIGLVDRIFARIGAQDEIHAGQSTFMVEMVETARLLSGSSPRSLLILDEIGRGTSTYDGLAIARSVIEFIHNNPRLNCRTLFATHYHELTELPNLLPRCANFNVAVAEQGDDIVFLHRVMPGGADQSYGVHVAQLAGMPRSVVDRARELLFQLEEGGSDFSLRKPPPQHQQMSFFDTPENPALGALRSLEVDGLSPLEALTKLYELKRMVAEA